MKYTINLILLSLIPICICSSCKKEEVPIVATSEVTNITGTTATCGGTITSEGTSTVISRGVCWSTSTTPTIEDNKTIEGPGAGTYTSIITELEGATTYYVRAYASNSEGTGYGMTMSFTTLGEAPSVTDLYAHDISGNTAILWGHVNANYFMTDVFFEYGTSTSYGNTITAIQSPVIGNFAYGVTVQIGGLIGGTVYHYRIKAVNSFGTTYSDDMTFTTLLTDGDNNEYQFIQIGTQIWMAENLKATKYNDRTNIPLVSNATEWENLTTPGYSWYDNNETTYGDDYGALYNWYTINESKLCPIGWHVPTDAEWTTLTTYLGGESVAGGKLKETGTDHWESPNTGATNESVFTALPGGARNPYGIFNNIGNYGFWWTSTLEDTEALSRWLFSDNDDVQRSSHVKNEGFSVRCIKDE